MMYSPTPGEGGRLSESKPNRCSSVYNIINNPARNKLTHIIICGKEGRLCHIILKRFRYSM